MDSTSNTTASERYLLALLEDGDPWNVCSQGIYESIRLGYMDCDETGRQLSPDAGRETIRQEGSARCLTLPKRL